MTEHSDDIRNKLIKLILSRYEIDGCSLTEDEAWELLDRLDTEAEYLGAYVSDQ